MTRTVGQHDRSEWILDPVEALRRGRALDARLASTRMRLFAANSQTYDRLQEQVRTLQVDDVAIRTLDIEGLLKTKTEHRAKDRIDRKVLLEIKTRLQRPWCSGWAGRPRAYPRLRARTLSRRASIAADPTWAL